MNTKTFGKIAAGICVVILIHGAMAWFYASRDSFDLNIKTEQNYITESFGYDTSLAFHNKAERIYRDSVVTDAYMIFYDLFNVGATGKAEKNFKDFHEKTEKMLDACLMLVYLFCLRLFVFIHSFCWAIWAMIPILFSGYVWRQNRKVTFSYDSPEVLRWTVILTGLTAWGLAELFFIPCPIIPVVFTVITVVISLLAAISLAYLPKRN